MRSSTVVAGSVAITTLLNPVLGNSIVSYWGQNSGGSQQRLNHYCKNADVDIIPLAFLTDPGNPLSLNFANIGTDIGDDIKECQDAHGKTILLSLGGEVMNGHPFSSEDDAVQKARKLWAAFGPSDTSSNPSSAMRPFGNAVIDGFDFDNERVIEHLIPFGKELERLLKESSKKGERKYKLSATPQCIFPDANLGPLFLSGMAFDYIFIQHYNNPDCSNTAFVSGIKEQPAGGFNFGKWQDWATKSANPNVKIFVGATSSIHKNETGYVEPDRLAEIISYCKQFSHFGGVMLWEMSRAWDNREILTKARAALGRARPSTPTFVQPSPAPSKSCTPDLVGILENCSFSTSATRAPLSSSSSSSLSSKSSPLGLKQLSPSSSSSSSSSPQSSHSATSSSAPSIMPSSVFPLALTVAIIISLTVQSSLSSAPVSPYTVVAPTPSPSSTSKTTTEEFEPAPETKAVSVAEPVRSKAPLPQASVKGVVPEVWHKPSVDHVHQWNQCGGDDWDGGRTCQRPYVCKYFSNWYSQCE
ncbi:hypothetical protein VTL71DRAFT_9358 [Oculimacula yallundae]|uniref:chitinase n=1 Tax=Oculimacula yallundae TaxID=86028 RepID=A0ABR4BST5_9HELO